MQLYIQTNYGTYNVCATLGEITVNDVRVALEDATKGGYKIVLWDDSMSHRYCTVKPTVKGIVKLLQQIAINQ